MFDKLKRYAERKGIKVNESFKTGGGPTYNYNKRTIYTDGTRSPLFGYIGGQAERLEKEDMEI